MLLRKYLASFITLVSFSKYSTPVVQVSVTIHYLRSGQNAGAIQYTDCDWPDWNDDGLFDGKTVANYDQERYVDVTSETVIGLHRARIDLAHSIGCDGVDPDNIDTYVGFKRLCR